MDSRKLTLALGQWRDSLVNLSNRNKLLNYKKTRGTTIEFSDLSEAELYSRLVSTKPTYVVGVKESKDNEGAKQGPAGSVILESVDDVEFDYKAFSDSLFAKATQREIDGILAGISRAARREYMDKGINTLYLALGALHWVDDSEDKRTSPLILIPVNLTRSGQLEPLQLSRSDDDIAVNPALALKLQEYGIKLPTSDEVTEAISEDGIGRALELFRAIKFDSSWSLESFAALSVFAFQKEAMYRDLIDNEAVVAGNPIVQALGGGTKPEQSSFFFEPVDQNDIDELAPPEVAALVLDADASQRAAVVAAADGKSFVLDGPPGTGKSQTIANIIGELIHQGKTVLFVSEKIVALEVVKERLDQRGLGAFLFELHSHKSTRKEVARQLGDALRQRPVPPASMAQGDLAQVTALRKQLNDYVIAANEVRSPLQLSFHEVLGIIEQLGVDAPTPTIETPVSQLTTEDLTSIRDALKRLARHWEIYLQGEEAPWFGLENQNQLPFVIKKAVDTLDGFEQNLAPALQVASHFNVDGTQDGSTLKEILELWAAGSDFHDPHWLTARDVAGHKKAIDELRTAVKEIEKSAEACLEALGPAWDNLQVPNPHLLNLGQFGALQRLNGNWANVKLGSFRQYVSIAKDLYELLCKLENTLGEYCSNLGVTAPAQMQELGNFKVALELVTTKEVPPAIWLAGRTGFNRAKSAIFEIKPLVEDLEAAQARASTFAKTITELELRELSEFFRANKAVLNRFSSRYRLNKKLLMEQSLAGSWKETLAALPLALEWQRALLALRKAENRSASNLGDLYEGTATDWVRLQVLLESAETILDGFEVTDRDTFQRAVEDRELRAATSAMIANLESVSALWVSFSNSLDGQKISGSPRLSLAVVKKTLYEATSELDQLKVSIDGQSDHVRQGLSMRAFSEGLKRVNNYANLRQDLSKSLERLGALFGEIFAIEDITDGKALEMLAEKTKWTSQMRETLAIAKASSETDPPLSSEECSALSAASLPKGFLDSAKEWAQAWEELRGHFSSEIQMRLDSRVREFKSARELLEGLRLAEQDIPASFDLNKSVDTLSRFGLLPAVEVAAREKQTGNYAASYVLKALFASWVDDLLARDSRLIDDPTFGRDNSIQAYRDLDRRLKDAAVSEIIKSGLSRRPKFGQGQAGLIERESEKKTRHIPVRDLVDRSRDVIQALHPCFMMSPLAVSQYLPADIKFDVVIFDEASQVTPGDAINCIYRGNSLIAAGDQKQLPPMSFFAVSGFEDESVDEDVAGDYDSILDLMKASGSFNSMTLNWHYRSRHEHLIAYSNSAFYGGRLITFPGAESESSDLGLKMFRVDGVYRRAAGADNPIEAAAVAARIIHHFDTRSGLSLGVVAFSTAQRDAIENALTIARKSRPDLDAHFEGNRQDGFFVNSLEAVQGDERDVIIFSIGYGPDEHGKIYKQFGPLNRAGGERRLNVAITRARRLVEIVTSMGAADLSDVESVGARHLRKYLDFAERGPSALMMELGESGLGTDSPFEDSVINAIHSWGYEVQPQVGVAGYRIDIGVKHPNNPGAFILGVECDGAMYHSSKTARDRDRLRHEILEGLGWTIHHIWGTAWYRHRDRELSKLKELIDSQANKPLEGRLSVTHEQRKTAQIAIEFEQNDTDSRSTWAIEYTRSNPKTVAEDLDLADISSARALVDFLRQVVATEQPIHYDLIIQRLREASQISKVGRRIDATVRKALKLAKLQVDGEFIWLNDNRDVSARTPLPGAQREIRLVAPEELRAAIFSIVKEATGISRRDLVHSVKDVFGWKRAGAQIEAQLSVELEYLLSAGSLVESTGGLRISG